MKKVPIRLFPAAFIGVLAMSNLLPEPTLLVRLGRPAYLGIIVGLLVLHFFLKGLKGNRLRQ